MDSQPFNFDPGNQGKDIDPFKNISDYIFGYLENIIYKPQAPRPGIESLPESFRETGMGLQYLDSLVLEAKTFAKELALGNLNQPLPSPENEIASSLKMLHSSLKHLTWQTQQVAKGDYSQRVSFMGDFSAAFNNMIEQLEQRRKINLDEKTKLELYVDLILVNSPNPVLLFNNNEKLVYVSDSYFGYSRVFSRDEALGKNFRELFAPNVSEDSLLEISDLYKNAISEKHRFNTAHEIKFGDSRSSAFIDLQITPMYDTEGNSAGVLVFLFDMTESIAARREAERARELAEMSSRAKSNFLAKMSHEIRTPMNAIMGMADLAMRETVSPLAEEYLHTIRRAGENLLSIINDVLDFSKIEAGKLEIVPLEYNFSSLVNDVINIIKTRVLESRLRFVANIDSCIPNALLGDAIRIRQILLNILSNAVKYTEKGFISFSAIKETIENDTVNLKFEISDSGIGIKEEEIGMVFEEFSRFDNEKNKRIEGTGLGLAICRSLANAMNGSIQVRSVYGNGSTFTVMVPQKIRSDKKLAAVRNPEEKNLLIYERREIYANSINQTLYNLGVKYRTVSTASDFINCLVSRKFSHVILSSALYDKVIKNKPGGNPDIKFAVIADPGETVADQNVCTLIMPVFCISIANFLNGSQDLIASVSQAKSVRKNFTAPAARVLIVDDINTNLMVADGLLSAYKLQTTLCKSGMEAIEEIESKKFDLVLMDIMMPDMDGIETLAHIRKLGGAESYYGKVPVVALTAGAVYGTQEQMLECGFNDFMLKPIDKAQLNSVLETWIPKDKQIMPDSSNPEKNVKTQNGDAAIEGINVRKGIAMSGGVLENYLKTLTVFSNDVTEKIREITICLDTENFESYTIYVHALKSACAYVGAVRLSEMAADLENAAKRGDTLFIKSNSDIFLHDLEILQDDIKKFLADNAVKTGTDNLNREVFIDLLVKLKTALISLDSVGINRTVNNLHDFTLLPEVSGPLNTGIQNVLIGEYDEAISNIDSILKNS